MWHLKGFFTWFAIFDKRTIDQSYMVAGRSENLRVRTSNNVMGNGHNLPPGLNSVTWSAKIWGASPPSLGSDSPEPYRRCSLKMRFFRIKASFCIQCMHYQDWGIQANFWQKRRKKYPWKLSIWRASHLKWPLLYIFFLNVCCEFMQKAMARNWWLLLLFDTKKAGVGSSFQLVTKELPIEAYGTSTRYCMTKVLRVLEIQAADLTGSQIFRHIPTQRWVYYIRVRTVNS